MTTRLRRGLGSASAAVLLSLSLVACGDDGGSDGGGGGDSSQEQDSPPEEQAVKDALLGTDEIPSEFQAVGDGSDDDESDDDNPFADTCLEDVQDFDDVVGDPEVEAKVEYEQTGADLPANIEVGISWYDEDVSQDFADFSDELGSCPRVLSTVEGVTFDLTVTTEDVDVDADDATKFTMEGSLSTQGLQFPMKATVVAILDGHYVSTVSTFEFQTDVLSGEIDDWARQQFDNVLAID